MSGAKQQQGAASLTRERGVALVVVLLFLVAITGISVWTARQSMLAEGMARNQMDQEAARQAAESALRDAERDIDNAPLGVLMAGASCQRNGATTDTDGLSPSSFTIGCTGGLCLKDDASYASSDWSAATTSNTTVAEPWWPASKGGLWNDDETTKPGRDPVSSSNCDSFTGGVPLGTYSGVPAMRGVAKQPEYLIEVFQRKHVRINLDETQVTSTGEKANQWSTMYRITARGFGYSQRTQVVLQSVFFP
ncbi:PilX N-terminal domain-containing pilus assembly protein [Acidovorax sp. 69]|uniref:pilus assembly PilX family protein n=1 Tax=Acidovorax sp. 69 TaxID=2035202 RepID=UPI001E380E93|nr:PilX N-terminal domain-containing pilus assembly protein [Acidovorax sp. 69]